MIGITPNMHRVLAVVATATAVAGFGCQTGSSPVTSGPAGRHEPAAVVVISDAPAEFMPSALMIRAGDTVEWRNTGGITHSVEFVDEAAPEGTASSPSGIIAPNEIYTYTFKAPGTYTYVCRFHVINGMIGKIIVLADEPAAATTADAR
ncbi:MAG: plastocyanin/azurin family copper-binding protein [Candidatus Binatus sp.]|jgi:plastocyanin